jgi:hypothetical protein
MSLRLSPRAASSTFGFFGGLAFGGIKKNKEKELVVAE